MRIFVVDGNWYLWRAAHVYKSILPMAEGLPYDVLAMVMKDALQLKAHATLVAFDGARLFRNKLYPEYKANRREGRLNDGQHDAENGPVRGDLRDQVYGALPGIYQLFDEVGLAYYQPPKYEADDVLCSVAHAFGNEHTVICGTKDKDAYQYLRPSVRLYDSSAKGKDGKSKPRFITEEDCVKKFGVLPRQMIAYQTLLGDPGDNIMPLPNMKPARVKKLLNEYGSVTKWMAKRQRGEDIPDSASGTSPPQ
ncbi:5'-3' exonuclease [Ralstonia phage phiRSL1]|uniref:5'-3' exonuclease n=1 Tax=Ralstonia phage phiRSL1 TaxID=1980924 RepID=B2ZY57_9CAUD|nr:5'-3' exonuclease [Ralstonia phage phiRSL1]BAG41625.1 5'-3' exonuclease [Ralstonia phage phiRSL1]